MSRSQRLAAAVVASLPLIWASAPVAAGNPERLRESRVIPYVIVHHTHNGKTHPGGGPGGGGGGGSEDHSSHYVLLPGKWTTPSVTYVVEDPGITGAVQAVQDSFTAWDAISGISFTFAGTAAVNANAELSGPNASNTVSWALLVGTWTNALAVTVIYITDANANGQWDANEAIAETDVVFNSKYTWAIDPDGEGPLKPGIKGKWYDIPNVGTHEAAHVVGLDDQSQWDDETTYFSAGSGETKKRSLEPGDIAGAQVLYGS